MSSQAILLVNTGTPTALTVEAIRDYLRVFLSDSRIVCLPRFFWIPLLHGFILPRRPHMTMHAYRRIWTPEGSPYTLYSNSVERKLKQLIALEIANKTGAATEPPLLRMAQRYSEPSMSAALKLFRDHDAKDLTVLPLYPQQAFATTESVRDELLRQFEQLDYHPRLRFIDNYHDDKMYIEAIAKSVRVAMARGFNPADSRLIFSFHSTTVKDRERGDQYFSQTHRTAQLVAAAANLPDNSWQVAYQSRFERSQKWLAPTLPQTLEDMAFKGIKNFYVITPGFAIDNIETLDEIAVAAKHQAELLGAKSFNYIPALNDSRDHIALLAGLLGFQAD